MLYSWIITLTSVLAWWNDHQLFKNCTSSSSLSIHEHAMIISPGTLTCFCLSLHQNWWHTDNTVVYLPPWIEYLSLFCFVTSQWSHVVFFWGLWLIMYSLVEWQPFEFYVDAVNVSCYNEIYKLISVIVCILSSQSLMYQVWFIFSWGVFIS